MPTYEYACQSCGRHVEVYQSFSDEPLTTCSVCGGPLRKVFHPAGILFKGSGFYKTDSRQAAKQGAATGSGSGAAGAGSKPEGSKEPSTSSASGTGSPSTPGSSKPSGGSGASSSSGSTGSGSGGATEKSA